MIRRLACQDVGATIIGIILSFFLSFFSLSGTVTFLPEGVVVGFYYACAYMADILLYDSKYCIQVINAYGVPEYGFPNVRYY